MTVLWDEALNARVLLEINGEWLDMGQVLAAADDYITDELLDVLLGRMISEDRRLLATDLKITAGRSDERSDVDASEVQFVLLNLDGWLTPENRNSPWWSEMPGGWDLNTPVQIQVDGDVLWQGEVSEIRPTWPEGDVSIPAGVTWDGEVVTWDGEPITFGTSDPGWALVTITASGILRRLQQRHKPLRSPLTRLAVVNTRAGRIEDHWSFEEGSEATEIANSVPSRPAARMEGFSLSSDAALLGSDPLPKLSKGSDGSWAATVQASGLEGHWGVSLFGSMSERPEITETPPLLRWEIRCTGTITKWRVDVYYDSNLGTDLIWVRGFDSDGNMAAESTLLDVPPSFFGRPMEYRFEIGPGEYKFLFRDVNSQSFWQSFGHVGDHGEIGHPTRINGGYVDAPCDVVVGHLFTFDPSLLDVMWSSPADIGFLGEYGGARQVRVFGEEGVPFQLAGDPAGTAKMGPQRSGSLVDITRECATSDAAPQQELRTLLGMGQRTRRSRYNQAPYWTIDAHVDGLVNPFTPIRDDQQIVNDQTVERIGGSKRSATDETSIEKFGRYDASIALSLDTDLKGRLRNQAGWRLHVGADQGMRYPQLSVDFGTIRDPAPAIALWKAMRVGNVIRVVNLPEQHNTLLPLDLVVEGWTETLSAFGWTVTMNCSPAKPWTVARWGVSRYWPRNSRLSSAVTEDADTLPVLADGSGWTTHAASMPQDVLVGGAERVTVTGISGGSPQTFFVIRNVNSLGRAHPRGASVVPWDSSILGL